MSEASGLRQMAFPPDVLARIAPDVSLQRHLSVGLRPSLRNFNEFQPMEISKGNLNHLGNNAVIGSSIAKKGDTSLFCGITIGIVENSLDSIASHTSLYPVVDILRGRSGAPTDEEMILSQKLYETVLHSQIIPTEALKITTGNQIINEEEKTSTILYPGLSAEDDLILEDIPSFNNKKSYSFVLYAHLKIFSRSGPLFDLCYNALMNALSDVKLPRIYVGDTSDQIKVPVRSRGNFGHLSGGDNLFIDANEELQYRLNLNEEEIGVSSSFGLIDLEEDASNEANLENDMEVDTEKKSIILVDLEGDAEESCITSKINIISDKSGDNLKNVSINGGGANITLDVLKESIRFAKLRAQNI